ncbi:MAG TPA: hypothetical protein VGA09_00515 [Candidatus Binatia bacterium]
MAENNAVVGIYNFDSEVEASIKELQRSARDDSMGGSLWEVE